MITRQALLDLDYRVTRQLTVADKPGLVRNLARFLAHSGDSWFWIIGLIVVWLFGNPDWKFLAIVMAIGIVLTAGLVFLIKYLVHRQRPEGEWGGIYRKTDPNSFPSGHAARAVMLSVISLGLGPGWLGLTLALWAPMVVLARVAMGVHYLSDVVAGALLGLGVGLIVLKFLGIIQLFFG